MGRWSQGFVLNCALARDSVEFSAPPRFQPGIRELEGGLLVLHVPLGDGELVLLAAKLEVRSGYLGDDRDLCIVEARFGALELIF